MHTLEELHAHYQAVRARIEAAGLKKKTELRLVHPEPPPPVPLPVKAKVVKEPQKPADSKFEVYSTPAQRVLMEVAARHNISVKQMISKDRFNYLVAARQEACYILRVELGYSLSQIGRVIGKRDHTTVLHGYNQHKKKLAKSGELEASQVVSDGCAEEADHSQYDLA